MTATLSWVDALIPPGRVVVAVARPHWTAAVTPITWALVWLAPSFVHGLDASQDRLFFALELLASMRSIGEAGKRVLDSTRCALVITTTDILLLRNSGDIERRAIPHTAITGISAHQDLFDRLFGTWTIHIETSADIRINGGDGATQMKHSQNDLALRSVPDGLAILARIEHAQRWRPA